MIIPIALLLIDGPRIQAGDLWSGTEVLHFTNEKEEIDETHRFKLAWKVVKFEDDTWIVDKNTTLISTSIGGAELPPPPYKDPTPSRTLLSSAGLPIVNQPFDPGVLGYDRLITFWMPKATPETWSVEMPTVPDHYVAQARAEFKLVSKSETACDYEMNYLSIADNRGLTATGHVWFSPKTGRLLKAQIDAHHSALPGTKAVADVTIAYTDSSFSKKV